MDSFIHLTVMPAFIQNIYQVFLACYLEGKEWRQFFNLWCKIISEKLNILVNFGSS